MGVFVRELRLPLSGLDDVSFVPRGGHGVKRHGVSAPRQRRQPEAEVLQEERFTQLLDDGRSPGHDPPHTTHPSCEGEIKIRVLVRFAPGVEPPRKAATIRSSAEHSSTNLLITASITRRSLDQAHTKSLAGQPGVDLRGFEGAVPLKKGHC